MEEKITEIETVATEKVEEIETKEGFCKKVCRKAKENKKKIFIGLGIATGAVIVGAIGLKIRSNKLTDMATEEIVDTTIEEFIKDTVGEGLEVIAEEAPKIIK